MATSSTILSKDQAKLVISNFKQQLNDYGNEYVGNDYSGILNVTKQLYYTINQMISQYGEKVVGSALEITRHHFNFAQPWLYYDVWEGYSYDVAQDEFVEDLIDLLIEFIEEVYTEILEREAEKEAKKAEQEALEQEYKKERARLQRSIRAKEKAGVDVKITVPKAPKKITAAAVRSLKAKTAKVRAKGGKKK